MVSRVRSLFSRAVLLAASFSLSAWSCFCSSGDGPAGLVGAVVVAAFFGSVGLVEAAGLAPDAAAGAPVFG